MQDTHSIILRKLSKRYGERPILDAISLTFRAGETTVILGPSGSGKSTMLRSINGLSPFDDGDITVGPHVLKPGHSVADSAAVRRLFGMIFQDFQLFPHMTALANVMEGPVQVLKQSPQAAKEIAWDLLKRVGLGERADHYPKQLSGGQKQRVAIARALAMRPRGLLCDEITSALDPELKCEVLEVLEDLKAEGMTLLMVTHELGFARRAADRVIILADGKVIEDGPPEEVLDHPQSPRAQRFLSQMLL
jgi:polar amino acid transport system ATP-binding protein